MSAKNYIITGPNGVGKSKIIDTLVTDRPDIFTHVKGSAVLKQCLGVTTYDELRNFTDEHKNDAFNDAMTSIIRQSTEDETGIGKINLMDAHLLYFNKGEVQTCVMPWTSTVDGIAAVEADPKLILERIRSDAASGTRERSILPDRELSPGAAALLLECYVATSNGFAHNFGDEHGIPVIDIDNSGSTREAARQLLCGFMIDTTLDKTTASV